MENDDWPQAYDDLNKWDRAQNDGKGVENEQLGDEEEMRRWDAANESGRAIFAFCDKPYFWPLHYGVMAGRSYRLGPFLMGFATMFLIGLLIRWQGENLAYWDLRGEAVVILVLIVMTAQKGCIGHTFLKDIAARFRKKIR